MKTIGVFKSVDKINYAFLCLGQKNKRYGHIIAAEMLGRAGLFLCVTLNVMHLHGIRRGSGIILDGVSFDDA